ncbi:hypothetical protein Q0Z83_007230 [Actinoplanes sichuanensis]|uniref:DUF1775 domain-containing protein n=1 Tax=Actinoplanes sichuanensis TaxID=512349 RepID=A0ABW4AFK2_9ACTN|nr:DUF1775 domain-containing protein [Actinoplanes sichuanensis]BEL02532.1 hypothetical protein Q0Z83_007230 [Actinoplanes sichuanensis]
MRHLGLARRAGVITAVTAVGVLFAGGAAMADVTVNPATAPQGSGANLTFHVTNDGTSPIGEVALKIPADTPVAEVYPLSHPDWAPKITYQKLQQPLSTIHGGTPATEAAESITWIAVNGTTIAPGASADLSVAIGPMPTLSTMRFMVETKFADGKAGPVMPATMTLTPSNGGIPVHHSGTGTTTATDDTTAEDALFAELVANATEGPSWLSISGWIVAALALLGAGWTMLRGRHRAVEDEKPAEDEKEPADDEEKEPVGAGSSKWAYKGE